MAKRVPLAYSRDKQHRKNFIKIINSFNGKYAKWQIWDDFIYLSAAALSQPIDFKQEREDEYLRRINRYEKTEQKLLTEMLGELILEFEENGCHDVLGEMYMELEMYNKWIGQFFTPAHIAGCMAKMVESSKEEVERQGFISVCDPCCGAGVLLIEFANNCKSVDVNYQQDVLFVGQDIDPVVAKMCYIQMALLGMPGYIKIGNTFIPKDTEYWFTPMYLLSGFAWRKQKQSDEEIAEPKAIEVSEQILREAKNGQFQLVFD